MPNTEVKLLSADCSEGFPCESRTSPRELLFWRFSSAGRAPALQAGVSGSIPLTSIFEPLAQLVEHLTFNQRVTGSSPVRLIFIFHLRVAELADALDLDLAPQGVGFKSLHPHIWLSSVGRASDL